MARTAVAIDLLWLPLGAGGHSVRLNGKVYEAIVAGLERRPRYDLYHSALEVSLDGAAFVIEMTPVPDADGRTRGAVVEGPVGARAAARLRIFRYEVRRWRGGVIPDAAEAVDSPVRVSEDEAQALRLLDLVPQVPPLVWGRDEARAGDMWNCNSIIAWLLSRAGVDTTWIAPPPGGRVPGWSAGLTLARRSAAGGRADRPRLPLVGPHLPAPGR